jgi:pilus assembly protein Flp/PilA
MTKFAQFFQDESGASAAEYALILAIVGLGIVAAVGSLRNAISDAINRTATTISNGS